MRRALPALVLAGLALSGPVVRSEDAENPAEIAYAATLAETGDAALDAALRATSRLVRLREDAPVTREGLIARALAEPEAMAEALRAEGYWGGTIAVRIAGEPAGAPGLAERLPATGPVPVEIAVTPGPRYRLARVALRAASPDEAAAVAALGSPPGLDPGEPARAGAVLDAEDALLARLRDAGHPLAAVADRAVLVDHDRHGMDVTWTLAPGPAARFAAPAVAGQTRVDPALVGKVAGRLTGEPYSPERLERARRAVLALGAFETVRARAARRLNPAGALPTSFELADRPRRAIGFTLAYETNYGPSGSVYWEHRNLFGNAERLRVEAEVARLGESGGLEDATYRLGASLRRPGLGSEGATTGLASAFAVRERLSAYDRNALVLSAGIERALTERIAWQAGPVFEQGEVGRTGDLRPFTLLGLQGVIRYDGTDSLLDPRRGSRAQVALTPYADLAGGGAFARLRLTGSTYLDLAGDGATVLALRASLGSILGAGRRDIPLDKRFYAGGGGSVRGFAYQGIGPRDGAGRAEGGISVTEASLELRQRVSGPIGVAAFLDAGSVGGTEAPGVSDLRMGAGLGLRYATAIGPLRADIALPLHRVEGGAGYGIYIGLGQAF